MEAQGGASEVSVNLQFLFLGSGKMSVFSL